MRPFQQKLALNRKEYLSEAEFRKLRRTKQNKVLEDLVEEIKADIEELKNRPPNI